MVSFIGGGNHSSHRNFTDPLQVTNEYKLEKKPKEQSGMDNTGTQQATLDTWHRTKTNRYNTGK